MHDIGKDLHNIWVNLHNLWVNLLNQFAVRVVFLKIYPTDKNFTRPTVAPVAPNINSVMQSTNFMSMQKRDTFESFDLIYQ